MSYRAYIYGCRQGWCAVLEYVLKDFRVDRSQFLVDLALRRRSALSLQRHGFYFPPDHQHDHSGGQ